MRSILDSLRDTLKYLGVVAELPDQFDKHERRLVFQAIVIGVVVWAVVFSLKTAVHEAAHAIMHWVEHSSTPFVLFIPLLIGALLVALIVSWRSSTIYYREADGHVHELLDMEGDGLERAISLYFSSEPTFEQSLLGSQGVEARWERPTWDLAFRKWVATLITLASGGSGGLEASVTLIGESTAAGLFKPREVVERRTGWFGRFWDWWKQSTTDDLQTAQLCGIAAAVSVLFGAPFAAAFFAIEVMYRRRPVVEKLVYALISSLIAFLLSDLFTGGATALFHVEERIKPAANFDYFAAVAVMSLVIAVVSVYFSNLRKSFEHGFHHLQPNVWRRHLLGAAFTGCVAIVVFYLIPVLVEFGIAPESAMEHRLGLVLGAGEGAIDSALAGNMALWVAVIALFAKMIATLATVGSGGSAGLLVPSIFFGAMVASVSAEITGIPAQTLIIPAITASLVSIVNVPLAAILLPVELFGADYMLPALVVLVVSFIFAHRNTIYRTQREVYEGREILPGYSTRRIGIPAPWVGKTLIELNLRQRFDISVIGVIERYDAEGHVAPQVRLNPDPDKPLTFDDTLVIIGTDGQLKTFAAAVQAKDAIYVEKTSG
ncbi:MAG: chloride channel protein [Candidatus Promineifilaceae bacterium]